MNRSHQSSSFGPLFWTLAALTSPASGLMRVRPLAQPQQSLGTGGRGALARAGRAVALWFERRRYRRELMRLDEHILKDIGLTRSQAEAEWRKPFWRA